MDIKYVSFEQVCKINVTVRSASRNAVLFGGGLRFALDHIKYAYDDLDHMDAVCFKCAYLWHNVASNQYFADGNKRTSYVSARVFLNLNGMDLHASDDEKFLKSVEIARGLYTVDAIAGWIRGALK